MGARGEALTQERNNRAWLAWHIASLMRQTKLPRLESLLVRKPKRSQTPEEMLGIVRMLNAMYGGKEMKAKK